MSIRQLNGYWTIYSGEQPVVSCESFQVAWAAVWEIACEMAS
jgi:hypothetical protein